MVGSANHVSDLIFPPDALLQVLHERRKPLPAVGNKR